MDSVTIKKKDGSSASWFICDECRIVLSPKSTHTVVDTGEDLFVFCSACKSPSIVPLWEV